MKILGIIMGVITAILGASAFFMPFRTFLAIGWILGAALMVNGIEMIILALAKKKKDIWGCVLGAVFAIGGVILLFSGIQRALTDVMIAYMIGISLVLSGIMQVVTGYKAHKAKTGNSAVNIICGIFSVIVGILAVTHPILTMISAGYMIGISVMVQGINLVILFWNMKKDN